MIHNPPFALDKMTVETRQFESVLKQTYSRLDALEAKLRELIADAVEKFALDPADAIQWRAEAAIENQTTLSLLVEVRYAINNAETLESVLERFASLASRYKDSIVSWAAQGETSSSAMSNITSRATLAATAKMFGTWGLAKEIERLIEDDIKESQKRIVVAEFVDLKVDEHFRTSPDMSSMMFRKLSPRKAVECVYPFDKAPKHSFNTRDTVYVFKVPSESDVLYTEETVAA